MNDLQKEVKIFCKNHNIECSPEHRMLDLISEVGELAKEALKMSNYGAQPFAYKKEFETEIGDVLFALIALANNFDVDLQSVLEHVLQNIKKKSNKKVLLIQ